jgi:hypothetical protein
MDSPLNVRTSDHTRTKLEVLITRDRTPRMPTPMTPQRPLLLRQVLKMRLHTGVKLLAGQLVLALPQASELLIRRRVERYVTRRRHVGMLARISGSDTTTT